MQGIAARRAGRRNDRDGVTVRVRNGVAAAGAGERSLTARGVVVAEGGCFGVLVAVAAGTGMKRYRDVKLSTDYKLSDTIDFSDDFEDTEVIDEIEELEEIDVNDEAVTEADETTEE